MITLGTMSKKPLLLLVWICNGVLLCFATGCHHSAKLQDETSDSFSTGDDLGISDTVNINSTPVVLDTADTFESVDTTGDSDSEYIGETDADTSQDQVAEIIIFNFTGQTIYLDYLKHSRVTRVGDNSGDYIPLQENESICPQTCDFLEALGSCYVPCFDFGEYYAIPPATQLILYWRMIRWEPASVAVANNPDCYCHNEVPLEDGDYLIRTQVYWSTSCPEGECPEPEEAAFMDSYLLTGESTPFTGEFSVPLLDSSIHVYIEALPPE